MFLFLLQEHSSSSDDLSEGLPALALTWLGAEAGLGAFREWREREGAITTATASLDAWFTDSGVALYLAVGGQFG
jgi:hypothetical protein